MSKAKKTSKPKMPKADKIRLNIRYGVSIPETDLMQLISNGGCAKKLRTMRKEIKEWVDDLSAAEYWTYDVTKANGYAQVLATVANVLDIIEGAWTEALKEYAEDTKLPEHVKFPKQDKPSKGKAKLGTLSKEEQAKVKELRKQGFSIKAIGKTIHRAEKVVAEFVKTVDRKKK